MPNVILSRARTPWSRADRWAERVRNLRGWALVGTATDPARFRPALGLQWLRAREHAGAVDAAYRARLARLRLPVVPCRNAAYDAALEACAEIENRALTVARLALARAKIAADGVTDPRAYTIDLSLEPKGAPASAVRPQDRDAFLYLSGLLKPDESRDAMAKRHAAERIVFGAPRA
jgi:hypothetical protein